MRQEISKIVQLNKNPFNTLKIQSTIVLQGLSFQRGLRLRNWKMDVGSGRRGRYQ